jgi:hypothetical protein
VRRSECVNRHELYYYTKPSYVCDSVYTVVRGVSECEEGVEPWLEIKWLGTDPDFKNQSTKIRGLRMVKSLGGAWKTITPQSKNAYPR